jgi:hypothetical protein
MTDPTDADTLALLRERVREAHRAAEQLRASTAGESAHRAAFAEQAPPAGWDSDEPLRATTSEIQALAELIDSLRTLLPEELREQLSELVRQLLLVMRAVIDWMVARVERESRGQDVEIEDIPIS